MCNHKSDDPNNGRILVRTGLLSVGCGARENQACRDECEQNLEIGVQMRHVLPVWLTCPYLDAMTSWSFAVSTYC